MCMSCSKSHWWWNTNFKWAIVVLLWRWNEWPRKERGGVSLWELTTRIIMMNKLWKFLRFSSQSLLLWGLLEGDRCWSVSAWCSPETEWKLLLWATWWRSSPGPWTPRPPAPPWQCSPQWLLPQLQLTLLLMVRSFESEQLAWKGEKTGDALRNFYGII